MSPSVRRLMVVGVAVAVLAVVVVGALALGVSVEDGPPDPDALQDRIEERNRSIDSYAATIRGTVETENGTRNVTYRLAVDRPDRMNITYLAPENASGDVVIRNESGVFTYDRSRNELISLDVNGSRSSDPLGELVNAVTGNKSAFEGEDRIDGSSGVVLQYSAGGADVGLRIGGSAPATRFSSANETDRVDLSVWIDPERNLPVRFRQRFTIGNKTTTMTLRITNLTLNPSFDADRFRISLPPNATVVDRQLETRRFQSRAAMARNLSMSVPDPAVPENFSFAGAAWARDDENRSVALTYRKGRASLLVVKRRPPFSLPGSDNATRVDLGEVRGRYVTTPTGSYVTWTCDGASYQVTGLVDRETQIDVAKSVGCE